MKLTMWPSSITVLLMAPVLCSAVIVQQGTQSRNSFAQSSRSGVATQLRIANAVSQPVSPAPSAASGAVNPSRQSRNTNTIQEQMSNFGVQACSCGCCEVAERKPNDYVTLSNGQLITSECARINSPAAQTQTSCSSMCQIPYSNAILESVQGPVDYNRFCTYNCQPLASSVGSKCMNLVASVYNQAQSDSSGNGADFAANAPPLLGNLNASSATGYAISGSGGGGASPALGGQGAQGGTAAGPQAAAALSSSQAASGQPSVEIVYDMRKLIAERLRSEAGASVAAAAASAERARINEWHAKESTKLLKKLRVKTGAVAAKVEGGIAGVEAAKQKAAEAAKKAEKARKESEGLAVDLAKTTKKLADAAITKAIVPAAAFVAKGKAEAKGLDKPEDWVKVVAARAANPYQAAVTAAVQRSAEYKRLADGLMGQAFSTQQKANDLITHVNVLEAQGDTIGAIIEKKQVTNLLARARAIQDQAKAARQTADSTQRTIPKWQNAAAQAAAYAAWEYSNNAKAFR